MSSLAPADGEISELCRVEEDPHPFKGNGKICLWNKPLPANIKRWFYYDQHPYYYQCFETEEEAQAFKDFVIRESQSSPHVCGTEEFCTELIGQYRKIRGVL